MSQLWKERTFLQGWFPLRKTLQWKMVRHEQDEKRNIGANDAYVLMKEETEL